MNTLTKLYTPEEVADLLQVSKNLVYELIASKEIYAKKVGRVYRIPAAAVDYFTHNLDYHHLVINASKELGHLHLPHVSHEEIDTTPKGPLD
ncbi:MAG: helix-turn-helix domain-containing protein [bacterium]|nr:helix-turn-helix domain-containing protein [bacterium]